MGSMISRASPAGHAGHLPPRTQFSLLDSFETKATLKDEVQGIEDDGRRGRRVEDEASNNAMCRDESKLTITTLGIELSVARSRHTPGTLLFRRNKLCRRRVGHEDMGDKLEALMS